eukprot:jgi/Astpho2/393/e_gw1.00011.235.1_t
MQAKASMLVVGLANSGKTSIVQALKAERSLDDTVPTVGFSVERFHMLNTMLTVVDMSGQPKYQKLWECYYDDVQGVILVIDAADQAQLSDAKGIVQRLQAHTDLEDTPLLIFANKMDLAHALHVSDIAAALDLTEQPERQWQIAASSALTGEGLEEGMRWLLGHIATQSKKSRLRKQSMKQLKVDSPTTRPQQQQQVAAAY